mmetsp:Transcript_10193/g.7634  ORF Transcript_10193/g.7634 Transcript_10193/m.7634 type:complete len:121 (-) Transcript_10193:357-719(-)
MSQVTMLLEVSGVCESSGKKQSHSYELSIAMSPHFNEYEKHIQATQDLILLNELPEIKHLMFRHVHKEVFVRDNCRHLLMYAVIKNDVSHCETIGAFIERAKTTTKHRNFPLERLIFYLV